MEISYLVKELNKNDKFRKDYCIQNNLGIDELNKALSSWDENNIRNYVIKMLNQKFLKLKKKIRTIIIDSSPILLDINTNKKYYSDEELKEKTFLMDLTP